MTDYIIGDEEYAEEINTSYDQEQDIGDTPSSYFASSKPINAKNGQTNSRLGESHECKTYDGDCVCETCDTDADEYHNYSCKTCKRTKGFLYGESAEFTDEDQEWMDNFVREEEEREERERYDNMTESLNKDGTGTKRATRGVDPKNTPATVLQFVYVSKSECDICKQYDGMVFSIDSPNRPVIPRLESQGKKGGRPYTHPNCKCKWVKVFSDAGIKNFEETPRVHPNIKTMESYANEIKQETIDRARKYYGKGFDELDLIHKNYVMIEMLKKSLGMEQNDSHDPKDGRFTTKNGGSKQVSKYGSGSPTKNKERIISNISKTYPSMTREFISKQLEKADSVRSKAINSNSIIKDDLSRFKGVKISGRIKEAESMVGKLGRKPEEYGDVDDLYDVSGVRAMAKDLNGVNDVVNHIKQNYTVIQEEDNINVDKGGYRSYHVIVQDEHGVKSEIQVRTENQDVWANWCHDRFYKPATPKMQEFINSYKELITNYSLGMSNYYYEKDLGLNPVKPECPPEIEEVGCLK